MEQLPHAIDVRPIPPEATLDLRMRILRPGFAGDDLRFPGDDDADTLHAGAFAGTRLVGITSIYRAPAPFDQSGREDQWQIRGVAVEADVRRSGVASALMEACSAHAVQRGCSLVWCNARVEAIPFYRAHGFAESGGVFDIPNVGPHVVMWRRCAA